MPSVIEADRLTRSYGRRRGIEAVDLSVPEGSLFGFLGPNGAGKSTAIRVLLGLLRPSGGQARIFGEDCWRASRSIKARVGYVPGDLRLYSWMNGRLALSIAGKVRRMDLGPRGRDLADYFNLDLKVRVRNMSRGMRQKLGLILALAPKPRLLILDEPTTTLDPIMQQRLHEQLRRLAADGHTVFFSSHTLSEVEQLCDRVAIIREGRIVAAETLAELRHRAGHEVMIRWRDSPPPAGAAPAFLRIVKADPHTWSALLNGSIDQMLAWLAGRGIDDLAIGRPDLESLFRRYYEQDGGHA